jgi:biopolymer transport protein ExbD
MTLEKGFLHYKFRDLNISSKNIYSGITLGVLFAFSFYCLLYMSRESVRLISFGDEILNRQIWVFTDEEVRFYNFFFAFISTVFGQSVCFNFWFSTCNGQKRRIRGLKQIIHDQRFFNWVFIEWFGKTAFLYGFFLSTMSGYYIFSFYPDYKYFFVLFGIVLLLQTWISIRKYFKRNSLKMMVVVYPVILVVAFLISKINLIDYQDINNNLRVSDPYVKYNLELPEAEFYDKGFEKKSLLMDLGVVKVNSINMLFSEKGELFETNKIDSLIAGFLENIYFRNVRNVTLMLHIDKRIDYPYFYQLKKLISKQDIIRVGFRVVPVERDAPWQAYSETCIPFRLLPFQYYLTSDTTNDKYEFNVYVNPGPEYILSQKSVAAKELADLIGLMIKKDKNNILTLNFCTDCTYNDYIKTLSLYILTLNKLRDSASMQLFNKPYSFLNDEEMNIVREIIPYRIKDKEWCRK